MMTIGRICIKTAGRDSGKACAIIEQIDETFVMIDGQTRRKKVNIKHLEPTKHIAKINKNATHEDVIKALENAGYKQKKKKVSHKGQTSEKKAEKVKKPAKK